MSTRTDAPTPQTRRERRAAERRHGTSTARRSSGRQGARRGPPLLWATALVGVVALVFIGGLVVVHGSAPARIEAAGLRAPASPAPVGLAQARSLGKVDAPVTLELWSDFQCPSCGQFAEVVEPALIRDYVTPGTLRIVHHDAAFQGSRAGSAYDESIEAAAGARCAADQDRYWPFHDWLFANQSGENLGAFADARLRAIATSAGLDVSTWDACRSTGTRQAAARAETQQGVAQGVTATPTMYLNGETIVGLHTAKELGAKIEAAAAAARP